MKWRPYPKYKKSGIEWLGDVPAHWRIEKFSRKVRITEGQVDPEIEPYASMTLIAPNHVESNTGRLIATETAAEQLATSGKYYCQQGAVIYSKIRPALAKATLAPEDCLCSADMYPMVPSSELDSRFLLAMLLTTPFTAWSVLESDRVAMPKINRETLAELRVPVPELEEQRMIAAFLEHQTARIDALVGSKRKLIGRLEEKRIVLISCTVTRGFPPESAHALGRGSCATFKSSGIERLGDVPQHWSRPLRLSLLAASEKHSFVNGPFGSDLLTTEFQPEGVPVVFIRDIRENGYRRTSDVFVSPEKATKLDFCRVDPFDVLVAKVGDPPGTAAVYPSDEPSGIVTQDVIRIRVDRSIVTPEYLVYFLNSLPGRSLIANIAVEATRIRVSLGDYKASLCCLPPLPEQEAIVEYLRSAVGKIDQMVATIESAIEHLLEYRSALITAAVTGKIDVRNASGDN